MTEVGRGEAIADQVCMTPIGCDRCSGDFRSYMVRDDVWGNEAGQPEYGSLLCLSCLTRAIGRPLRAGDFEDCDANNWKPWSTV